MRVMSLEQIMRLDPIVLPGGCAVCREFSTNAVGKAEGREERGEQAVHIGSSIGITIFPADGRDRDALIKAADAAMYEAKRVGNAYRFFRT